MYTEKIITRDKLYELVWSKPMVDIAAEYGVSDKMIAKICEKLNVPTPGLGYWRKIEVGENVPKPRLPDILPNFPTEHTIRKQSEPSLELIISNEAQEIIDTLNDPVNKISVPEKGGHIHKILRNTKSTLRLRDSRSNILESGREVGVFRVTISNQESARLFRILDVLIKELENRKFPVYIENESLKVKIFGMGIGFTLREKIKRIELPKRPDSHWSEYEYKPSGKLLLSIEDLYIDHPTRRNFTDNNSGKVEDKLNDFIIALIICSQALIANSKYREEQHRIQREKEKRREAIISQIKEEEKKLAELEKNIELFNKANIIRNYVEKLKLKNQGNALDDEKKKELDDYIKWALEQADRYDPLVESPKSILDMKEKVSRWGWDRDEE